MIETFIDFTDMENDPSWNHYFDEDALKLAFSISPEGDVGKIYSILYGLTLDVLKRHGVISDYRETDRNSEDDKEGIDFWIDFNDLTIPISITGKTSHLKERKKKHPNIPVISVRRADKEAMETKSVRGLAMETVSKLRKYIKNNEV